MSMTAPLARPEHQYFSSGPCAKRPGWQIQNLQDASLGRSHRAKAAKTRLKLGVELTRQFCRSPPIIASASFPARNKGAVEMALWSLLGHRGVDVLTWESFGEGWVTDIVKQLKLKDVRILKAGYGEIIDLKTVNFDNDVVFTWNGTTSGVRVPNGDWIAADRKGLTICDATSAAFAQETRLAEARCRDFLLAESAWRRGGTWHADSFAARCGETPQLYAALAIPKIFRMTSGGKLIEGIFESETINTPSMLCVEDYIDALNWGKSLGGLDALIARADANTKALADWVAKTPWVDFLAKDATIRSNTSVCLEVVDPAITELAPDAQASFAKSLASLLEKEKVAYDVGAYRDAPPGLRILVRRDGRDEGYRGADALARFRLRNSEGRSRQRMTFSRGPPSGSPSWRQPR